ncbi:mucoidy inhibitor a [Lentinula edodes]|uniref:Mucoidy inhibitor a n=1 Tax=Lentinula edodes TaxID=5353 RepID=A0A1Q3ELD5_LENED|nr:mucoidy inhibitor a [Lentinula edodes]
MAIDASALLDGDGRQLTAAIPSGRLFPHGNPSTTRSYYKHHFTRLSEGQQITSCQLNQLYITGLPNVIEQESLRVQGHGDATIHDVSLSTMPAQAQITTSPTLPELLARKDLIRNAIHRARTSSRALEAYMGSMSVHDVPLSQVGLFLESYNLHGSKLDEELARLKNEEDEVYKEIQTQKDRIAAEQLCQSGGGTLGMQVSVGLFAENEGQIELQLVYAVFSANWEAIYDIRVNVESKDHPLTLVYKAAIVQNTGEDWTNVPLTLETTTPSYGVLIPTLNPLKLSTYRKPYRVVQPMSIIPAPGVIYRGLSMFHLMWFAVPKIDTRVHLNAKIKNVSEYALIPGKASVYVDGTFIARTDVPASGPDETFDCSLGLDSSVKITYHPLSSKITHRTPFTGFTGINSLSTFGTTKTTTTLYSQRITVVNTKRGSIAAMKILDRVPVSEDERIKVKVLTPTELEQSKLAMIFDGKIGRGQSHSRVQNEAILPGTATIKGPDSRKVDDASSLVSSKTGSTIGKRFSSMRIPFSARKSQDGFSGISPSSQSGLGSSVGGEKAVSVSNASTVQTPQAPATSRQTPVMRIVAQWDGAETDMEHLHSSSPNENANNFDDTNFISVTAESSKSTVVVGTGTGMDRAGKAADGVKSAYTGSELGGDGKMNWLLYDIAPQGTVKLVLEWEVSAASSLERLTNTKGILKLFLLPSGQIQCSVISIDIHELPGHLNSGLSEIEAVELVSDAFGLLYPSVVWTYASL